jgi:hypothetical protein
MASTNNISNTSENTASKIGDIARGIHGMGEQIRGTFNKGVDDVCMHDEAQVLTGTARRRDILQQAQSQ